MALVYGILHHCQQHSLGAASFGDKYQMDFELWLSNLARRAVRIGKCERRSGWLTQIELVLPPSVARGQSADAAPMSVWGNRRPHASKLASGK